MEVKAFLFAVFFSTFVFSVAASMSIQSLDSTIRDYAFDTLVRSRTGVLHEVPLPSDLSGVGASAVRLRSWDLYRRGANFSSFRIPPRTTTAPIAKRLIFVYQNLSNWSTSYAPANYSLVTPVVGLFAYDASSSATTAGIRGINLRVLRGSVSITFPKVTLPKGLSATIKCARFGWNGTVKLFDRTSKNVCSTTSTGHFAMVVQRRTPEEVVPGSPPAAAKRRIVLVVACGGGIVGLMCLVGLVGIGISKYARNKKMEKMKLQAEEGEALDVVWVGRSKVPSATMTRTQPELEN